jgi:16S rRNA (cytosine967-C5)-methyltransferase
MNTVSRQTQPATGTGADARALAATAVDAVLTEGHTLERALELAASDQLSSRDRALIQALAYGAVRGHHRHRRIIDMMLQRPIARRDSVVVALISVGLYQLIDARQPDYAAVSATVEATVPLGKIHHRGLVNALLRRFLRERDQLFAEMMADDEGRYGHPDWLIRQIRQDWPDHWQAVLDAGNQPPPMWLRVNRRRGNLAEYRQRLQAAFGDDGVTLSGVPDAVCLSKPVPVTELPGFAAGDVSVQDAASQFAVELIDPQPGMRVLDACAAPGGKTTHLLERESGLRELVALDQSAERLLRLRENLDRLGLQATVVAGNALNPSEWWDGLPFDRILLDSPCSATGVLRRHPDIKFLRRGSDIGKMAERQLQMINGLWELLAPGGRLVYATCSVLKAENSAVVTRFLAGPADVREDTTQAAPAFTLAGPAVAHGLQLLPGSGNIDGFYYALMERQQTNKKAKLRSKNC